MAISNFFVQDGLNVNNYITANSTTLKVGTNTTINSTAIRIGNAVGFALAANGDSLGSNGYYLTSNGTTVFWATVSAGSINTAASYTWSNVHHMYGYDLNIVALGSGNNFNINCAAGNYFTLTCNGSVSNIYFTNAPTTRAYACILKIANGGLNTVSYGNTISWPQAAAVTPSTNTDIYVFITDNSGTTWRGNRTMADSR